MVIYTEGKSILFFKCIWFVNMCYFMTITKLICSRYDLCARTGNLISFVKIPRRNENIVGNRSGITT